MESMNGKMELSMKENGKMIKCGGQGHIQVHKKLHIMENFEKINLKMANVHLIMKPVNM